MYETIMDLVYYTKKQNLNLNIIKMAECFYEQHKQRFGSNRDKICLDYNNSMQERVDWVENQLWDTIEAKIKSERFKVYSKIEKHTNNEFIKYMCAKIK